MRKKIEYRQWDEDGVKDDRLLIEISQIRSNDQMKDMIDEVNRLGFTVRCIEDGELMAYKLASGPLDIVDPIYDSYRSIARACDE
jgi:fructose-1,6-bisphosphatase/sedoheptulose 1,7-bisphosphatase-like protein